MKLLGLIAVIAVVLMFAVTSCDDRTRETCDSLPTAPRCIR